MLIVGGGRLGADRGEKGRAIITTKSTSKKCIDGKEGDTFLMILVFNLIAVDGWRLLPTDKLQNGSDRPFGTNKVGISYWID